MIEYKDYMCHESRLFSFSYKLYIYTYIYIYIYRIFPTREISPTPRAENVFIYPLHTRTPGKIPTTKFLFPLHQKSISFTSK